MCQQRHTSRSSCTSSRCVSIEVFVVDLDESAHTNGLPTKAMSVGSEIPLRCTYRAHATTHRTHLHLVSTTDKEGIPRQCRGNGSVGLCSSAQHSDEPQAARPLDRPKIHVIQRSRVLLFNTTQGEKENHDALLQPKLRSLFYPPPTTASSIHECQIRTQRSLAHVLYFYYQERAIHE